MNIIDYAKTSKIMSKVREIAEIDKFVPQPVPVIFNESFSGNDLKNKNNEENKYRIECNYERILELKNRCSDLINPAQKAGFIYAKTALLVDREFLLLFLFYRQTIPYFQIACR